jgi:PII-like signaling protein
MLSKGPAKRVVIFVNEDTTYHHGSLYEAILTFLLHKGVSGATATKALAGFGAHHHLHTPNVEALAEHLPVRIEFIESTERVDALLPTLYEMVSDGLIEVQDTTIIKVARKEAQPEPKLSHVESSGPAKMIRVFIGEADRWNGEPLYDAIVKRLRLMDVWGATVYRGILGYGAKGHTHRAARIPLNNDLPVMISIVERAERVPEIRDIIQSMLSDGLIVISDVEMIRLLRKL